jgi:hypothetical protein
MSLHGLEKSIIHGAIEQINTPRLTTMIPLRNKYIHIAIILFSVYYILCYKK